MKTATLYRQESEDDGTSGFMTFRGGWWNSLELPDRDNKRGISCIPKGEYICKLRYSPHFKRETYHLQNVKDRTYILIHSANFAGDVEKGYQSHLNGCIALGKGRGRINNKFKNVQKAVLTSKAAVREFMEMMNNEEFKLKIEDL